MEMEKFEESLSRMTKPEVKELMHEEALAKGIASVRDKSTVSLWWLSIPVYLIAAFIMKSLYTPGLSIDSAFQELFESQSYLSALLFLVLPILLVVINFINAKQLLFLYGQSDGMGRLKLVLVEVIVIAVSLIVLIIYLLWSM